MAEKNKFKDTAIVGILLVVYLFYYSYRYILKMNSEGTSPTYSSTPMLFQMAKYLLVFLVLGAAVLLNFRRKIGKTNTLTFHVCFWLILISLFDFIITRDIYNLVFGISLVPCLIAYCFDFKFDLKIISKIFSFFVFFSIAYELLQIGLYFLYGRLPALGYPTGSIFDVRFGGPWDDPNGFSIILGLMIPFSFNYYKGALKYVITSILCVFLLLTWSLTGFASLGIVFIFYLIKKINFNKKYSMKRYLLFAFLLVILMVIGLRVLFSDSLQVFIENKMGSIISHIDGFDISDMSIFTFLGITPISNHVESGYIRLLYSGGIIVVVLFLSLFFVSLKKLKGKIKETDNSVYKAIYYYEICFMIACINLPMIHLFSNFGIFCICMAISFMNEPKLKTNESVISLCKDNPNVPMIPLTDLRREIMNLCFVINHNYVEQLMVTLYSCKKNNSNVELSAYVIEKDLTEEDKEKLREFSNRISISISFIDVDDEMFKNCSHMETDASYTTYYKLFILSKLNHLDRVLYIDCDLVVNGDITEFYNLKFDKFLGVVKDREMMNGSKGYIKRIVGSKNSDYFNAGVILFNFYPGYQNDIPPMESIIEYLDKEASSLSTHDQDVFNHFFNQNLYFVDNIYNYFALYHHVYQLLFPIPNCKNPKIIHYVGFKPWQCDYVGFFKKTYMKYYEETKEIYDISFYKKTVVSKKIKKYFVMWRTKLHRFVNMIFKK